MGRIVVGVDGSDPANAALKWAGDESKLRSATLQAVCAYHVPSGWFGVDGTTSILSIPVAMEDLERHAQETIDAAVSATFGDDQPLDLDKTVAMGQPADVLIDTADGADLLVLGNRGHGDLGSVLLGSVGMHCVHHAPCPVVIVRTPKKPHHD